jgi:A/G-specific adenine glycosylase
MLLLMLGNEVLLEKRPTSGIWGGLWSLPEVSREDDALLACRQRYQIDASLLPALPMLKHTFTHFTLNITPQPLLVNRRLQHAAETGAIWLDIEDAAGAALPAPIKKLLLQMQQRKLEAAA